MRAFFDNGFALVPSALLDDELRELSVHVNALGDVGPGTRCLLSNHWCRDLAKRLRGSNKLKAFIPSNHVAVQCTYFTKSASCNWRVPVHHDLSAPVVQRRGLPGWGPWSVKEGVVFVQPPVSVLEQFVAVLVHLDPCAVDDGPLTVVPGTHALGLLSRAAAVVLRGREQTCIAQAGDALVLRPLLVHRSSKASGESRRRVLHFLFAPGNLDGAPEWHAAV